MHWLTICIIILFAILFIAILVKLNRKDEKQYEEEMNQTYPHSTDAIKDIEAEEFL
jgi:ABC-type bacteriocin/lantibiotic exporter with double-glycine peptidase domain